MLLFIIAWQRELCNSYEVRIKQLQQELSAFKSEAARAESSMSEALAVKNSEIDALVNSLEVLKKQASASEGKATSLQVLLLTVKFFYCALCLVQGHV